ncbi:UNVERIFIED_CONTAM: hypothetical protein Scaly_0161200 [Sesamum calycinum]|uniref:Uncharacterized protein n=1 Tax=Sesamum calycinum TaxID=2727403 RepID=A0AAW2SZ42_9LAMI
MSSSQRKLSPNPNPSFDEKQWVIQIRRALDEELEEETETPIRIFTVPKPLLAIHPDSYIPHQVSVGPYHYTRPELREMERYKLAAAKRNHKDFQNLKLQLLVDCLLELEPKIRACYNKYLKFNGETLAWMMAVDASFLFEFLQVCAVKHGKETMMTNVVSSRLSYLVGKLLGLLFSSSEKADETLLRMLIGFCEELSPFRMVGEDLSNIYQVRDCAHLLDVLYRFCVPKLEGFSYMDSESVEEAVQVKEECCRDERCAASDDRDGERLQKVWIKVLNFQAPLNFIKKIVFSKPMKMIVRLPWTILSNLPMLKVTKQLLETSSIPWMKTRRAVKVEVLRIASHTSPIARRNQNPFRDRARQGRDVNSEVVLRNLVAYEACSASGPLVLARYTELMNGIIDTEEDAKFLCERGIIRNHLKSDEEVADLWNGMSKSIRLTKVAFLDKVIEDVNKYHSGMWKVKCGKYMKKYVFGSWRLLTFLAAILMLLFYGFTSLLLCV